MDEWQTLTQNKTFITDLGVDKTAEVNGEPVHVGRYAVWSPLSNGKGHTVIEVGSDLAYLRQKYGIAQERVFLAVS